MVKFSLIWATTALAVLLTPTLAQKTGQTNKGDRKVGIVIDESNSMQENDPNNTRIDAGIALNDYLIASDEKANGVTPDQVTIVGFHSSPDLLYPLGDPKGAGAVIKNITSNKPGTFIGGGLGTAINETTKAGTGTTANRTGIVVLTDGQDNYSGLTGVQGTINQIIRAASLGIRVSFGFLSVDASAQDEEILTEILKTGGTFSSFSTAESQKNFIDQVILQGLTGQDATAASGTTLLPGLTTSAILSPNNNTFTYVGRANEKLNFTVTSLTSSIALQVELRDAIKKAQIIPLQKTNTTGIARVETTLPANANVELVVSVDGTFHDGIVAVGVQSSLGLDAGRADPKKSSAGLGKALSWPAVVYSLAGLFLGALFL